MQYLNNNHNHPIVDEDEIDIKEVFNTLLRYKKSILFIAMIGTLYAFFHAYFSPNIYQTQMMIKLTSEDYSSNSNDFLNMAIRRESSSIEDELVVFNTSHIAQETLQKPDLGTQYYVTKYFKTRELYKNSPFIVTYESLDAKVEGIRFQLIPVDEKTFRLLIEPSLKTEIIQKLRSYISPLLEENKALTYNEVHKFGQKINTTWFTLTIQKIHDLQEANYAFSINKNENMVGLIQGGVSATSHHEFSNIITVSFQDTVALRAKVILDAIAKTYIVEDLNLKTEEANKKLHFIDIQLSAINRKLEGSSKNLQSFKASNTIVNLTSQAQQTTVKLGSLESQLYEITMQIDILENIIQYMRTHKDIQGINIDSVLQVNTSLNRIISEMQKIAAQRAQMSVSYTASHPDFIRNTKQLDSLRNALRESILGSLRTLKKRKYSLNTLIQEHTATLQSLPEQEQKLEQLSRNFLVNENIYSFLLEKRAETAIIQSSTISNARVIEDADIPGAPIKPKRSLLILVGFILSLIVGIALAFLRDFIDNSIKAVEDIEKLTTIPMYGALPHLDDKKRMKHYEESMHVL